MVLLLCATIVVLSVWTIQAPLYWDRVEVDNFTGESIGQCVSNSMTIFVPILGVVMAIPTLLTCIMAWKTKDVDETFTESSWIFILIVDQIQVILVAIPLVVILRGVSTEGRYMGLILLIWTFPASTVTFIMFPKYKAYFDSVRGPHGRTTRGSAAGVKISGIPGTSGASRASRHSIEMEAAFVGETTSISDKIRALKSKARKVARFSDVPFAFRASSDPGNINDNSSKILDAVVGECKDPSDVIVSEEEVYGAQPLKASAPNWGAKNEKTDPRREE